MWWATLGLPTKRDQERTLHALNQLESRAARSRGEARRDAQREELSHGRHARTSSSGSRRAPSSTRSPSAGTRARFMVPTAGRRLARRSPGGVRRRRSASVALSSLVERGLEPGERAAIFAPNSVEWVAAALGDPGRRRRDGADLPGEHARSRSAYVVEHCDAKVRLRRHAGARSRALEAWATARVERIVRSTTRRRGRARRSRDGQAVPPIAEVERSSCVIAREPPARARRRTRFERTMDASRSISPALMLYTSGTSGNPKGVPLTHRNVGVNGARLARSATRRSSTRATSICSGCR